MGVHEFRVTEQGDDPRANALQAQVRTMFGEEIDVVTARVYHIEGDLTDEQRALLADRLFTDPNSQTVDLEPRDYTELAEDPQPIEVAYKPGVMNPEAESIVKGAQLLGVDVVAVDSSTEYRFALDTPFNAFSNTVNLLINKTVEEVRSTRPDTLVISGEPGTVETINLRDLDPEGLEQISSKRSLFLDEGELKNIQDHFKKLQRDPTDGELEYLGGAWSEHCCHKTFGAKIFVNGQEKDPLFKRLKDNSIPEFRDRVPSAFDDNAGVFTFYDGMCIAVKLETHNSPSALEPYGGAMTGTGGVIRDIMGTGKGAKNILSIDIFCTADPDLPADQLPENCLPPAHLLRRVIDGVRDYGNRFGVPTANGSIHHHRNFRAKPTVMVGTLGIIPEQYAEKGQAEFGDLVIAVGGRTGRDGIHGATFSSGSMTAETAAVHSSAVQIGNAIEEKRMADALLEARDGGLIRAITDCGAAGFSSAIGEMGEEIGVNADMSLAPLKYEGLAPWEVWMSESQERMVAAVAPEDVAAFQTICQKHGVESVALGTFGTENGARLNITYGGEPLVDLDYEFIKRGRTQREMAASWRAPELAEKPAKVANWETMLKQVMAHGNVRSRERVVRQYDHEVQATSALKPYGGVEKDAPNDGVVLTPILGKPYGLVVGHGMNPVLNDINPYWGTVWAFAEGMSNYVAVGGDPRQAFATNNFVTATPDEHVMGALDMAVDAITDSVRATGAPIISGKDSLSSRYKNKDGSFIDIPPVVTITVAGKIENVAKTVTSDIKQPGSTLVLVGKMDYEAMGGSVLYDIAKGSSAVVPRVDLEQLPKTLNAVHGAIQTGVVLAVHDVSEGGVAAAVAEMCFGGDCGAQLTIPLAMTAENALFNETAGCFVVEVRDDAAAKSLFEGTPYQVIGKTWDISLISVVQDQYEDITHVRPVKDADITDLPADRKVPVPRSLLQIATHELKAAWKQPMEDFYS